MNTEDIVKTLSGRSSSPLDDYRNLVNQPTWVDNVGDAFIDQGKVQALNKNQKLENAMMSGFGHGMKGGANSARAAKLAGLEEAAKQVALLDASAKISNGKIEAKQRAFQNFAIDNFVDFRKANEARAAGDEVAFNDIMGNMFARFSRASPEATKGMVYDHAYGDNSYFRAPDGKTQGINNKDILMPFISTLPEEMQRELPNLMSSTARTKFEKADLFRELSLEEKRADIENKYSQAKLHNTQADKTKHEMDNPEEPYNKEVANHNLAHIKEQRERKINAESLVATLNDLEGMIKDANKKGQAGSTLNATGRRLWGKYLSGDNESATLADMAKAAYFARVKEGGGSNPSTTEFLTVLETIPNVDKNPQAALKRLQFDREQALKVMYRYKKTEEGLRKTKYQGSPDDESIFKHDDDEYKAFSEKYYKPENKVKIQAPDGTIALVSPEFSKTLEKRGGKIINE